MRTVINKIKQQNLPFQQAPAISPSASPS